MSKTIKIAHSPDTDDAVMFYALKKGLVGAGSSRPNPYVFEFAERDIEELNQAAASAPYDITALSIHAYAHVSDKYILTASGMSMAEGDYGPVLIEKAHDASAAADTTHDDLNNKLIAVPGEWTTAFLVLKLMDPNIRHVVMPFDTITGAVLSGEVDAGLIIHEDQLLYTKMGLKKVCGIIDYWRQVAGDLPLPLGGNAIKKDLPYETIKDLATLQQASIVYALDHPDEIMSAARKGLSAAEARTYLGWYVNRRTVHAGEEGIKAIELLFELAYKQDLIPKKPNLEIV